MSNQKKLKTVFRWIRNEAKKLKPEFYAAAEKFHQAKLLKDGDGTVTGYQTAEVREDLPVNHYRRMKRAYKKYGIDAVHAYFGVRGFVPQDQVKTNENG